MGCSTLAALKAATFAAFPSVDLKGLNDGSTSRPGNIRRSGASACFPNPRRRLRRRCGSSCARMWFDLVCGKKADLTDDHSWFVTQKSCKPKACQENNLRLRSQLNFSSQNSPNQSASPSAQSTSPFATKALSFQNQN